MSDEATTEGEAVKRRFRLTEKQSKFAREVGSVVLGVLIALGIGEVADWARWQWRVSVSTEAMRAELSGNRYNAAERRTLQPCLEQRLADLGAILKEARRTHLLPDIGEIGRVSRRPTETSALDVATGEGVLLHMPRATARAYTADYKMAAYYDAEAQAEIEPWATLELMRGAPGPIDGDLLATLLDAWAQATKRGSWAGLMAKQVDEDLAAEGIQIEEFAAGDTYQALLRKHGPSTMCKPLIVDGKPFAHVGKPS